MGQNLGNNNDSNQRGNDNTEQQKDQDNLSLNTASGLRQQATLQEDASGSGRSYDYGSEGSTEEEMNQQLGLNSNQQNISGTQDASGQNNNSTTDLGNDSISGAGRSSSRAGSGSGMDTKRSTTGSDFDGQNRG
jgi:hypothetical protein